MNATYKMLVGLNDTYPEDKPEDIGVFLDGISRETVILLVSSFLGKKDIYSADLEETIGNWFRQSNQAFANDAFERLLRFQKVQQRPITIISQPSVLKLFSYANNHLRHENELTDEQIEINLFKALLYQNQLINEKEQFLGKSTKDVDAEIKFYALQFTNSVQFSDVINFDLSDVFITEFIRAVLLFEFLEQRSDAKILLNEFYKFYEVNDWRDFIKRIMGLTYLTFQKDKDGHIELEVPKDDSYVININFLEKLAMIEFDEVSDQDFKTIRERPLHRIEEGKYLIISEIFTMERIFKGLYFNLKAVNEKLKKDEKVKDWRFLYTFHFSEKHVFYQILQRAFPKKYLSFSGEQLEKLGCSGAPDFYIRNKNKVFIFESKDSLLNASIKESCNYSLLEPELVKKFYQDGKDAKAVNQMLNFVQEMSALNFLKWDKGYKIENTRIYPILIIHDRQLNVAGFNKIINYWFNKELAKIKKTKDLKCVVHPVTVIDISTLILVHELLHDRRILFEQVLENYHQTVSVKAVSRNFEESMFKSGLPFSAFIKEEVRKRNLPRVPTKLIKEKGVITFSKDDNMTIED